MNLTSEISLDQIDEWFQIGKKAATTITTVPGGKLHGRQLDPRTKQAHVPEKPNFDQHYPAYKRYR